MSFKQYSVFNSFTKKKLRMILSKFIIYTFISPSKRLRKRDYKTLGISIIYTLQSIQSLLAFRVVAPLIDKTWPINWCTLLILIHKFTPFFLQLVVETLDTQLNEQTNQNSKLNKSPQICKANEYMISVSNSPLSPPSLDIDRAIL